MTTKCTGIMGRIFGHKWSHEYKAIMVFQEWGIGCKLVKTCQRCEEMRDTKS